MESGSHEKDQRNTWEWTSPPPTHTTLRKGKAESDMGFYMIQWPLKIFIASPFSEDLVRYLVLILWETMGYCGRP